MLRSRALRTFGGWALVSFLCLFSGTLRADDLADLRAADARIERGEVATGKAEIEAIVARLGTPTTPAGRDVAARAHHSLARLADASRDYPTALAEYRALLAVDPGNYYAGGALVRVQALEERAASFTALAELDRVRSDPALAGDARAVIALGERARGWPASLTRDAALLFCAQALADRLSRLEPAYAFSIAVIDGAFDRDLNRHQAFMLAMAIAERRGRITIDGPDLLTRPGVPPEVVAKLRRSIRRAKLHRIAIVSLGAGALLATLCIALVTRARRWSVALAAFARWEAWLALVLVTASGYGLGERWESGQGQQFLGLALGLLAAHGLVALIRGALGHRRAAGRVVGGLVAAAVVVAAAYLSLERTEARGVPVLAAFGL
jgi:hypothetical protein